MDRLKVGYEPDSAVADARADVSVGFLMSQRISDLQSLVDIHLATIRKTGVTPNGPHPEHIPDYIWKGLLKEACKKGMQLIGSASTDHETEKAKTQHSGLCAKFAKGSSSPALRTLSK